MLLQRLTLASSRLPLGGSLASLLFRSPVSMAPAQNFSTTRRACQQEQPIETYPVDLARKTTKHVLSRKTFLVDYYKYLNDNNEIVLYAHHNNLLKNDTLKVRADLKKLGAKLTYVRNNLYGVYLRSENEADPALHKNTLKNKNKNHPLAQLLNGPTAVITIPLCDPAGVALVMKVLKQAGEKLFLIGARIETGVYTAAQVEEFKTLPSKDELRGQLAGLLSVLGGAGLVRTLESAGTGLYLTLGQREKDLGGDDDASPLDN